MGSFSLWHWLVVGLVVLVLFGRGKISGIMGDFGKGAREFRKGMKDEEDERERELASQNPDKAPASKVTIDQRERGETPVDQALDRD